MKKAALLIVGVLLIVIGLLTPLTTAFVTFLLPEQFSSTARISPAATNPAALTAEIQKIQSNAILDQVITNLNLTAQWGRKYRQPGDLVGVRSYSILKEMLTVSFARNTAVIEVSVFSDDREEAARIANTIAAVYCDSTLGSKILAPAQPNVRPVRPNEPLNIGIALVLGAILAGVGILLLIASLKRPKP